MILFSEIAISLLGSDDSFEDDHFLKGKTFYVCCLCILITPFIVKKKIQDLKFTTYILIVGVVSLMTLLTALFIKNGTYEYQIEEGIIQP